jgi:hypothetical protein
MNTIAKADLGVEVKEGEKDVAKEIIKNAIRSAICIDDLYAAPYSYPDENLNFEDPKKLFYSFRKNGHCDLDIYQYTNSEEWTKHKYLLHNKDLLIQDWELNSSPGPGEAKYDQTLSILKDIFENKIIPFVLIYTNREDLSEVSKELLSNFNNYSKDDFELIVDELMVVFKGISSKSDEILPYLEEDKQIQIFHEYIKSPKQRPNIQDEILTKLAAILSVEIKIVKRKIKTVINNLIGNQSFEEAFLMLSNICLSQERHDKDVKTENIRVDIDRLCYSINGTIVLLVNKEDVNGGVKPESLFDVFSQSVTNNPHSIINLISIELKDKFREDFSKIGTSFNTIDESAFLYHAKNYYQKNNITGVIEFQKTPFKNFVVRSWIHELQQKNLDLNLDSFSLIESEINKHVFKKDEELHYSLAKYASMVSTINLANKNNHKLGFGDVFKSGDHYFLCITPHCDCFSPNKINHEFYFTKNLDYTPKLGSALKEAEQGHYSFISNGKRPQVIHWSCKPFTSHIPKEMNESIVKSITYSGASYELEFICSLKENYTQRISNNSFGQGHRVGIDLPHLVSKS